MENEKLINVKCSNPKCDSKHLILLNLNGHCRCPKCGKEVLLSLG